MVTAGGLVLGISRNEVTPPAAHARDADSEIFLVGQSRFTKVNLVVDHARHQVQTGAIDRLIDFDVRTRINIEDASACDDHRSDADLIGKRRCERCETEFGIGILGHR